jgi:glycosyltransferase involved in cell wall biosynthesis
MFRFFIQYRHFLARGYVRRAAVSAQCLSTFIPLRNASALAVALRKLIDNPALCRQMGGHSRVRAESEFGLETVIARTLAVYRVACA